MAFVLSINLWFSFQTWGGKGWSCEEVMGSVAKVEGLGTRKDPFPSDIEKTRGGRIQE